VTASARLLPTCLLMFALCLVNSTPLANAAPRSTADVERLIKRAGDLRRQGKDQEALPLFEQAYQAAQTPRTAAQLGLCEMQLGYWLSAESHLTEALAGRSDSWMQRYRSTLEQALNGVQAQLGELVVSGTPAAADVSINGRSASGRLPIGPVRVVAGMVKVEMQAPGYVAKTETVSVTARGRAQVSMNLEKLSQASSAEPVPHPRSEQAASIVAPANAASEGAWPASKIGGAVLLGTGIVAAASGAVLLFLDKHQACDSPVAGGMCEQRTRTLGAGLGLVGGGVALAAAGVFFLYKAPSSRVAIGASPHSIILAARF
jgi:hypothetical protein